MLETYSTIKEFFDEFDSTIKKSNDEVLIFMAENHLTLCFEILNDYIDFLPEEEPEYEILNEAINIKNELIKFNNKYPKYSEVIGDYIGRLEENIQQLQDKILQSNKSKLIDTLELYFNGTPIKEHGIESSFLADFINIFQRIVKNFGTTNTLKPQNYLIKSLLPGSVKIILEAEANSILETNTTIALDILKQTFSKNISEIKQTLTSKQKKTLNGLVKLLSEKKCSIRITDHFMGKKEIFQLNTDEADKYYKKFQEAKLLTETKTLRGYIEGVRSYKQIMDVKFSDQFNNKIQEIIYPEHLDQKIREFYVNKEHLYILTLDIKITESATDDAKAEFHLIDITE